MIQVLQNGQRKLVAIACALFLVACAATGQYKTIASADAASITQGMTREQVEQKLGPAPTQQKDKDGNMVLKYIYETGSAWRGSLWVTVDQATGKVIQTGTFAY